MENRYNAFLCYARANDIPVRCIRAELEIRGITFFDVRNVIETVDFKNYIEQSIELCDICVVFYSKAAAQSNAVLNEIRFAISKGKHILPVLLDDTLLPQELAYYNAFKFEDDIRDVCLDNLARLIIECALHKRSQQSATKSSPSAEPQPTPIIQNREKKGNIEWKNILYIILSILYLLLISLTYQSGNYLEAILLFLPLVIGALAIIYLHLNNRYFSLKLFCDAEVESDIVIKIDGEEVSTIKPQNLVSINKRKGTYLISICPISKELNSISFKHTFTNNNDGEIKEIMLQKQHKTNDVVRYKCFIGGSTTLTSERNAVRATLGQLYNKWEDENLIVSAYTFEDFSNAQHQQERYFNFISNEAKCTIFIITDGIGPKTVEEYRLAYETYKKLNIRPMIFVYADEKVNNPSVCEFKNEVLKNNSYWRGYKDIETLMSKLREDVDAELWAIFKMGLKK